MERLKEQMSILAVSLTFLLIFLFVIVVAVTRPLRILTMLYSVWAIFYTHPEIPLAVFGALIILSSILILTYRGLNRRVIVDSSLSMIGIGIPLLHVFLTSLHLLNVDVFALIPYLLVNLPPLSAANPLGAISALLVISVKAFFLQRLLISERLESSLLERLLISIGLGVGVTSLQVMLLSFLHLASLSYILYSDISIVLILTVASLYYNAPSSFIRDSEINLRSIISKIELLTRDSWLLLKISVVAALLLISSYYSIGAVLEWDSLAYIAHYARIIYYTNGVLDESGPSIGLEMSASYPTGFQSLAVYFYKYVGSADDLYIRLLSAAFFPLLLSACYLFFRDFFSRNESLTGILLVASTPLLGYYMVMSGHYMPYLIYTATLALHLEIRYLREKRFKWLILSSIFSGFSSIISYLGLSIFILLLISLLVMGELSLKSMLCMIIGALLPSSYIIRNIFLHGDPLYPILSRSNSFLWASRTKHFYLTSIYSGINFSSPFSLSDFLFMRMLGIKPWGVLTLLITPLLLIYLRRVRRVWVTEDEKLLLTLFSSSILIFLLNPTFERYLLPSIAVHMSIFLWIMRSSRRFGLRRLNVALRAVIPYATALTLACILSFPLTSVSEGYIPSSTGNPIDKYSYLSLFYPGEADCWYWINENTAPNVKIATYDIKYYYIEREIVPLDGKLSIPLYRRNMDVNKAIRYLRSIGVEYVFSSSSASPMNPATPPAYYMNPIVPYLGDPAFFPVVYARHDSAVYHVGPLDRGALNAVIKRFISNRIIPPLINYPMTLNFKVGLESLRLHLYVPSDYHRSVRFILSIKGNGKYSILLLRGVVNGPASPFIHPHLITSDEGTNPSINWIVEGGSYTLIISKAENSESHINIKVSILFKRLNDAS